MNLLHTAGTKANTFLLSFKNAISQRHCRNITTLIIARVNNVLLRKQKGILKVCVWVMKTKQRVPQLADLGHEGDEKSQQKLS